MNLNLDQIKDEQVRDNFLSLLDLIRNSPFLNGHWKLFEASFRSNVIGMIKHDLKFAPKDVLVTYVSNGETATVDFEHTNKDYIVLNISGPCKVRVLAGFVTAEGEL